MCAVIMEFCQVADVASVSDASQIGQFPCTLRGNSLLVCIVYVLYCARASIA
jgi:hypothetical protein